MSSLRSTPAGSNPRSINFKKFMEGLDGKGPSDQWQMFAKIQHRLKPHQHEKLMQVMIHRSPKN